MGKGCIWSVLPNPATAGPMTLQGCSLLQGTLQDGLQCCSHEHETSFSFLVDHTSGFAVNEVPINHTKTLPMNLWST